MHTNDPTKSRDSIGRYCADRDEGYVSRFTKLSVMYKLGMSAEKHWCNIAIWLRLSRV